MGIALRVAIVLTLMGCVQTVQDTGPVRYEASSGSYSGAHIEYRNGYGLLAELDVHGYTWSKTLPDSYAGFRCYLSVTSEGMATARIYVAGVMVATENNGADFSKAVIAEYIIE